MNTAQENQNNNNESKESAKYKDNIAALQLLFRDDPSILTPRKSIGNDVANDIIQELYEERAEDLRKEIKGEFKSLIDKKMAFDKALAEKYKEIKKLEEEKMKEFNGIANALFGKIKDFKGWLQELQTATVSTVAAASSDSSSASATGDAPASAASTEGNTTQS